MNVKSILEKIPDYEYFLTVDELDQNSRQLAEKFSENVNLLEIGSSRSGHRILCLKIGHEPQNALVFGCPHPNEPIGAMMLEFFSQKLASDPQLLSELGFTWYIIKCVDPDGTKLNEGWFRGPFTLYNYARNFFRPASHQQVEWTFPISYKTLKFSNPIPETKALMSIIDAVKPDFMYSLHNAGFGGAYWYISDAARDPWLYETFRKLARQNNVPLSLGEPEMPYAQKFAEAVYRVPSTKDTYNYCEKFTDEDPAKMISGGTSSIDYLKSKNENAFGLVCEVPYFYDARIEDTSLSDMIRKDAILNACEIRLEVYNFAKVEMEKIENYLSSENPFKVTLDDFLSTGQKSVDAEKHWAETSKECQRLATIAEKFDNLQVTRFYSMLTLGLLLRCAEYELECCQKRYSPAVISALEDVRNNAMVKLDQWNVALMEDLNYSVIPIKRLISIQLGSGLAVAEYVNLQK